MTVSFEMVYQKQIEIQAIIFSVKSQNSKKKVQLVAAAAWKSGNTLNETSSYFRQKYFLYMHFLKWCA